MAGYSFGNGLMLDPGEELRAGEERGKKSALTQLLGKAYSAPQQERGGLLGMAAAIDPQMAMQADTSFRTRDTSRRDDFIKRATMAAKAWKAGAKPMAQSIYQTLLPEAQAMAPDMPLPGEIDESFVKMAEMLGDPKDLPSSYQEYQLAQKDPGFMPFLQQKTLMTRPPQVGNINGTPVWIGPDGYREVPAAGQAPAGPQPMGAQPTGPKDEDAIYAKANEMAQAGMPQARVEAWLNQQLQAEVILPGPQTAQADIYSQPQPPITASPKVKQAWPALTPQQRRQVWEQEAGLVEDPKPRMLSDAEVAQEGLPPGTKAYRDKDGIVKTTYTPPASTSRPPNAVENLAAGYYDRMLSSESEMGAVLGTGYSPGRPRDHFTAGQGLLNYLATPEGQKYRQAQEDWVRAKLRKESGAAIPDSEMEREIRVYFPQPGDSPEVQKQKERSRKTAVEAMKRAAGRALDGPANASGGYRVGQIIEAGGKRYRVTGGDPSDPDVEEVR